MEAAGGKVKGEKEEARERWFFDIGHRFVRGVRAWLCSFFKKLARALPPPLEIISETLGPAERFTHDPLGGPARLIHTQILRIDALREPATPVSMISCFRAICSREGIASRKIPLLFLSTKFRRPVAGWSAVQ